MRKLLTPLLLLLSLFLAACETTDNTPPAAEAYTVSGTILDDLGDPLAGVAINYGGAAGPTATDVDGTWESPELTGSVTITPSRPDYAFTPESREVQEAADDVNFEGVRTFTLTVTVTDDEGDPVPGVTLTIELADGGTVTAETDEDGKGEIPSLVGEVIVTPEDDPAYTFTPPSFEASVAGSSVTFTRAMNDCSNGVGAPGTRAVPCEITLVEQLQNMQIAGYYRLGADIDASATRHWNAGKGFLPIGDAEPVGGAYPGAFTGRLDGNGHTIEGLFIKRQDEGPAGLFAALGEGAEVSALTLSDVDVTGGSDAGTLAGLLVGGVVAGVEVDGRGQGDLPGNVNVRTERVGGTHRPRLQRSHDRALP